ncbi:acetylornithine deacetylase [Paraburkholderia oxyphila]|uniref:acetylornithine deacetylase n=1 Tax=Paraburkholderia oxyphila TaxID=614212 RepID=UPI0005BDCF48|nr:acetylornithine deacetylase [Paraburkholderia oxyphila]
MSVYEAEAPVVAATGLSQSVVDWVHQLVSIDTTSHLPNLGLIETVRDALAREGIDATLIRDRREGWANLFATVPAHDGSTDGGIVLSGHTDVVPVAGQDWESDPFRPQWRDDRLYGRGTCDMKGFIGTALALVPRMRATKLAKPIHFALSYDEELGCVGAPSMIAELGKRGVRPSGCIVGEPTGMRPVIAHKGIHTYQCCVRGHAAHSSLTPKGVNAIEYAARLICHIRDIADQFRAQGPFDDLFDVPFTTAQTSLIEGGNAINTVPAECRFSFEFRNLPQVEPAAVFARIESWARNTLLPQMRSEHPSADIEFRQLSSSPGLDAAEEAAITQLVRALTGDRERRKVAYGTEAGLFAQVGIPTVVCGPGHIEQAHRANEYVSREQLASGEQFLRRLIRGLDAEVGETHAQARGDR